LCNAFGVNIGILARTQGGAAAPLTLGYGVVPLRGTTQLLAHASCYQNCATPKLALRAATQVEY
jgi:hypothetical protein